jgi:hypothetical protein
MAELAVINKHPVNIAFNILNDALSLSAWRVDQYSAQALPLSVFRSLF